MYPKFFFERFWESEQRNDLFVCMPFHSSLDERFKEIIVPASKEVGFDNAYRVKESADGNVVMDKILDGIANSKMILIDLSDDPQAPCKYTRHTNGNVLYEAGIAHALREPSAIIMIRDQDPTTAEFDIRGLTINQPSKGELTKDWLASLLKSSLENHQWSESYRVKAAAESIDDIGLSLLWEIGRRPTGWNHFNTLSFSAETKVSVLRLIDLGILRFATNRFEKPLEHSYSWTSFGYEVMKYLNIGQMTEEEFKKTPGYPEDQKQREEYLKKKAQFEKSIK